MFVKCGSQLFVKCLYPEKELWCILTKSYVSQTLSLMIWCISYYLIIPKAQNKTSMTITNLSLFQQIRTWIHLDYAWFIHLDCAWSTVFCIEDHYLDLYLGCWCWQSSNYWWLLCRHQPKPPGHRHCNHQWLQNVNNPHDCPCYHHDHHAKTYQKTTITL